MWSSGFWLYLTELHPFKKHSTVFSFPLINKKLYRQVLLELLPFAKTAKATAITPLLFVADVFNSFHSAVAVVVRVAELPFFDQTEECIYNIGRKLSA